PGQILFTLLAGICVYYANRTLHYLKLFELEHISYQTLLKMQVICIAINFIRYLDGPVSIFISGGMLSSSTAAFFNFVAMAFPHAMIIILYIKYIWFQYEPKTIVILSSIITILFSIPVIYYMYEYAENTCLDAFK